MFLKLVSGTICLLGSILAAFAEFETNLRKERRTDAIAKSLDKGVPFGRKAIKACDPKIAECLEKDRSLNVTSALTGFSASKALRHKLRWSAQQCSLGREIV